MRSRDAAGLLGVLTVANVVLHRAESRRVQAMAATAATAAALVTAVRSDADLDAMGFGTEHARRAARLGVAAGATAALAVTALVTTRQDLLTDRRPASMSTQEARRYVFVDMPLLTVVPEEVIFRGVLPAVLARPDVDPRVTEAVVSGLFGAWHVLPYRSLRSHHQGTADFAKRHGDGVTVAAHTLALTLAGAALQQLRRRSGHLLAPALAHYAANASGFLMARWAGRRAGVG